MASVELSERGSVERDLPLQPQSANLKQHRHRTNRVKAAGSYAACTAADMKYNRK